MEFGLLNAPFAQLRKDGISPVHKDYRWAIAKVQAGDPAWRNTVKDFTTFADDLFMNIQFQAISSYGDSVTVLR
jgi:hypothetical protein